MTVRELLQAVGGALLIMAAFCVIYFGLMTLEEAIYAWPK